MRSMRPSVLIGVVFLLSARQSLAGLPTVATCHCPARITLVGFTAGVADGFGTFTLDVRDQGNNPLYGASVVIDFSGCADIAICADQLDPGATVNCAAKTTRKFTDVSGAVSFIVLGGSNGAGGVHAPLHGARVFANGTLLATPTAAALDLDGSSGVGINDLSVWLGDFGATSPRGRADFDGDDSVGINDLSVWLSAFGLQGSAQSCVTRCP
jgi:hypothetical protein